MPKRLLLLRLGAIGDVVLTQPAVAALARHWPNTELIYVTSPQCAALLANNPHLHRTLAVKIPIDLIALVRFLRAQQADGLVDFQGKCRGWWLRMTRSWPYGVMYTSRPLQERWVAMGTGRYRQQQAVVWRYHQLVERMVGQPLPREPLRHDLSEQEVGQGAALLEDLQGDQDSRRLLPLIVLAPGARWWSKRWPLHHWQALLQQLQSHPCRMLLIGGPSEVALLTQLHQQVPTTLLAPPDLSLPMMAALIGQARVFVGQDSGPWHLARSMQIPSVALFGSTASNIFEAGQHRILAPTLSCAPCSFHGRSHCPRQHFACMEQLAPKRVLSAILGLLQGPARLDRVWA